MYANVNENILPCFVFRQAKEAGSDQTNHFEIMPTTTTILKLIAQSSSEIFDNELEGLVRTFYLEINSI